MSRLKTRSTIGLHFSYQRLILCGDAKMPSCDGRPREGLATCAIASRSSHSTPTGANCIAGQRSFPSTPQVFDLLEYLIRNRERVVSKDDLIDAIWNGRSVSDAALTTRLNAARSAIGNSGEEQRLIKTLPRKGFRFVGAGAGSGRRGSRCRFR